MTRANRKVKRAGDNPANRIAKDIGMTESQIAQGNLVVCGVSNHSEADQRHMTRSGTKHTVRRLTRIERLVKLGIIDKDQAIACQWYADQHCIGYDTVGCTANYDGAGGGGGGAPDFARSKAQYIARENFAYARLGIPPELVTLFDQVTLGFLGENDFRTVTKNETLRIGIAAWRLHGQVSHLIGDAS